MDRIKRIWAVVCAAALLLFAATPAHAAETTIASGAAGVFALEQVYLNVPELDVFFYANDASGNPYTPTMVQAAGLELKLGDTPLDVGIVAQAEEPRLYLLVIDNSESIPTVQFGSMLNAARSLVRAKGEDDQLMLYTTAGGVNCVLPATTDRLAAYKAIAGIRQAEGSMDFTAAAAEITEQIQAQYQALAPRKAVFVLSDESQVLHQLSLFGGMLTGAMANMNLELRAFLSADAPEWLSGLAMMTGGRVEICTKQGMPQAVLDRMAVMDTALEVRTEVPESAYGERLETLTLSVPSLGSAVQSSTTVYMGYKLEKPAVERVQVVGRNKLRLQFNQPVHAGADRPGLYHVVSKDIWNWRVEVQRVELAEDGLSATLYTEPLYEGAYTVGLEKVAARRSSVNVSSVRQGKTFRVAVWPRDRAFYIARFRTPLCMAALLLALLWGRRQLLRRRERSDEQEAEALHLLLHTAEDHAQPRRWVSLFVGRPGSIAEQRWSGMVEGSLLLGSDAAVCDLCVQDPAVLGQHCLLYVRGDTLMLHALQPEQGPVLVNGELLQGEYRLKNNDMLRIGQSIVRLVL